MKKMRKIAFPLLMVPAVLLGMGTLSSCSQAFGSADTNEIDVNVKTEGITLNMYTGFGSKLNDIFKSEKDGTGLLKDFEDLTGIKVNYTSKGGYDNLKKAINLSATNPKGLPQVANGYPDHFAGYISSNIQLRLDGLIKNDKNRDIKEPGSYTDLQGVKHTTLPHFDYDNFYQDYKTENETLEYKEDGSGYILGIPFNKSTEAMAYNKTFFDFFAGETGKALLTKHGVGEIKVPNTWAELTTYGKNINSILEKTGAFGGILENDGTVVANDDPAKETIFNGKGITKDMFRPFSYDSTENMFTTLVRQFDGTVTDVDKTTTGRGFVNYNSDAGRAAGDLVLQLWNDGVLGIPSTPFGEDRFCSNAFKGYKSVMTVGSTAGIYNNVPPANAFKVGIHPTLYRDEQHKYVLSQGTSLGLFQIPESDPQRDAKIVAGWKLIIFLTQEVNGLWSAKSGYFPACKKAAESEDYQEHIKNINASAGDQTMLDAAKINQEYYTNDEAGWIKFTDPGFRGSSEIRVEMGLIPGYLIDGVCKTSQEAIDKTLENLKDYIKN